MKLVCKELTPEMWPALETLFGKNGACGGCWCMYWRIEKGERYDDIKGAEARRRFRALVEAGKAHGILAFGSTRGLAGARPPRAGKAGGAPPDLEPVGWASFERRVELPRLDRAPSLKVVDAENVWSLPCFYVKAGWRGRGVAQALLAAAVKALRARGAKIAEGYPTKPSSEGKMGAAFAWTGLPSMFEAAGFELAEPRPAGKQRYRRKLR